jgi:hypothetical protein
VSSWGKVFVGPRAVDEDHSPGQAITITPFDEENGETGVAADRLIR